MTVAIAAIAPENEIITISDARLSYGEMIPAADDATMKNIKLSKRWGIMFAAVDATGFMPVVDEIFSKLGELDPGAKLRTTDFSTSAIMDAARKGYEKEFSERFFREKLARFGFADIAEFRRVGFAEMGKDLYHEYAMELARFDLGLELLVYGFDNIDYPCIFEVANPGKIINHTKRGYAAIGSGTLMALAALNKRSLGDNTADVIYRVFDAKFSAETARDVGKTTHAITLNKNGGNGFFVNSEVEQMHQIWKRDLERPHPPEAMKLIEKFQQGNGRKKRKSNNRTPKKNG